MEKTLSLERLHDELLKILKYVHSLCEEHNICYFLGYGSCLGAVRHHGFIPWDDDVDIIMPYPDYVRLIHVFQNLDGPYKFMCYENDNEASIAYGKIYDSRTVLIEEEVNSKPIGLYVDIFPLYGLPKSEIGIKYEFLKIQLLAFILSCARKRTVKGRNVTRTLARWILTPYAKKRGARYFVNNIHTVVRENRYEESEKVANLPPIYSMNNEILKKEIFLERVLVDFETIKAYIPKRYNEYLSTIYGDYMKLPPIEKRINPHKFSLIYLDN